jgi:hypothetical protein
MIPEQYHQKVLGWVDHEFQDCMTTRDTRVERESIALIAMPAMLVS